MEDQIINVSIKQVEIFSIFSSAISVVLGIVAITLSFIFYNMSVKASKESEKSATRIENNVNKLEILFDKLYSGTFDMMKETVSKMSSYVYENNDSTDSNKAILKEIDEKTKKIIEKSVMEIKESQKSEKELEKLITDIVDKSSRIVKDVNTEHIREAIINYLKNNGTATYPELKSYTENLGLIIGKGKDNTRYLFDQIRELYNEEIIENPFFIDDDRTYSISHSEPIRLK